MTEAETCREFVTPRPVEAGWGAAESVIGEQHSFANGRFIVAGSKVRRGKQRRTDYLLQDFCASLDDETYLSALVRMFEQALKVVAPLPKTQRPALCTRLRMVRVRSHDIGYGVGEDMDALLTEHGADD